MTESLVSYLESFNRKEGFFLVGSHSAASPGTAPTAALMNSALAVRSNSSTSSNRSAGVSLAVSPPSALRNRRYMVCGRGCGGRIWTDDLRVMR